MKKLLSALRNPFLLLLVLIVAIILLDKLIGIVVTASSGYTASDFAFYSPGLSFPAALNELIKEFWFAETIAVSIFPLLLLLLKKKSFIQTHVAPWIVASVVMLIGVGLQVRQTYLNHQQPYYLRDLSYEVHDGAIYYENYYDAIDPLLESVFPYLVRAQLPILAALGAGYAGLYIYRTIRHT